MKEIKQILAAYEAASSNNLKAALATVVHIEGSSYRAPGARMLIAEDGSLTGAISGGCLEGDALRKALTVINRGTPLLVTYDTSNDEDAVMGVQLGCNGILRVLIEPINHDEPGNPISILQTAAGIGNPAAIITFFSLENEKDTRQKTLGILKESSQEHTDISGIGIPIDRQSLLTDAKAVLSQKKPAFIAYSTIDGPLYAFIEYLEPELSLIIGGAGNDVLPLVQMADILGWNVTLLDGRPNYANKQRFPGCTIYMSDPAEALENMTIDRYTAVVLMSHNYDYDKALLKTLLPWDCRYIGMLGPQKRYERMAAELAAEGFPENDFNHVNSPVGLNIGAETAEEIALSVIAEIKAVFSGKDGRPLRNIQGHIHARDTTISNTQKHHHTF